MQPNNLKPRTCDCCRRENVLCINARYDLCEACFPRVIRVLLVISEVEPIYRSIRAIQELMAGEGLRPTDSRGQSA